MRTFTLALTMFCSVVVNRCSAQQQVFYVSPSGSSAGTGSITNPWDITTALSHPPAVRPGALIWLRGGLYSGTFISKLNGTAAAPIIVRQYPNERATLDSGGDDGVTLAVAGSYTWFWGFEITTSGGSRYARTAADLHRAAGVVNAQYPGMGVGCKFINMVVHDTLLGFGWWKEAQDSEIYGNLIYYNGWDMDDRQHGHGIYAQNASGTMRIGDNIIFGQFDVGIHLYGSATAPLNNFNVTGNIVFNNGSISKYGLSRNILVGGGTVAQNPVISDNVTYFPTKCCGTNDIGYDAGCTNLVMLRNYFINAGDTALNLKKCSVSAFSGNVFLGFTLGFDKTVLPANTYHVGRPTGVKSIVRPNKYEPGRAHIAIYNWALQDTVTVDISVARIPIGKSYSIRSAEDYYGRAITRVYDGKPINIPMTGWTVAAPIGSAPPSSALPEFGAFIVSVN